MLKMGINNNYQPISTKISGIFTELIFPELGDEECPFFRPKKYTPISGAAPNGYYM